MTRGSDPTSNYIGCSATSRLFVLTKNKPPGAAPNNHDNRHEPHPMFLSDQKKDISRTKTAGNIVFPGVFYVRLCFSRRPTPSVAWAFPAMFACPFGKMAHAATSFFVSEKTRRPLDSSRARHAVIYDIFSFSLFDKLAVTTRLMAPSKPISAVLSLFAYRTKHATRVAVLAFKPRDLRAFLFPPIGQTTFGFPPTKPKRC